MNYLFFFTNMCFNRKLFCKADFKREQKHRRSIFEPSDRFAHTLSLPINFVVNNAGTCTYHISHAQTETHTRSRTLTSWLLTWRERVRIPYPSMHTRQSPQKRKGENAAEVTALCALTINYWYYLLIIRQGEKKHLSHIMLFRPAIVLLP